MKWNKARSGSVLMEFIVVLPIYMLLLGFVFVVGEVSLHAINLASGDRLLSMQRETSTWLNVMGLYEKAVSPTKTAADETLPEDRALRYRDGTVMTDAKASEYGYDERTGLVADPAFRGPWSMVVAATVKDKYTLTPWTRALVMFWVNHRNRTTNGEFELEAGSAFHDWMDGTGLGRHEMFSKDLGVRRYGYYTLMRKRKDGAGQYRVGTGESVVMSQWRDEVVDEPWFDSKKAPLLDVDKCDEPRLGQSGAGGGNHRVYTRYGQYGNDRFVKWSK